MENYQKLEKIGEGMLHSSDFANIACLYRFCDILRSAIDSVLTL